MQSLNGSVGRNVKWQLCGGDRANRGERGGKRKRGGEKWACEKGKVHNSVKAQIALHPVGGTK